MRKRSLLLEEKLNLILVGESGVGKTSLLNQYTRGIFQNQVIATVGLEYFSKEETIENKKIKIKLWDTAGQEQYKSLTKNFFRNSNGIIIVFDVTNRRSFESIKEWHQNIKDNASPDVCLAIVGNKTDLEREICEEDAIILAKSLGNFKYFECSAKENKGFKECVCELVSDIKKVASGKLEPKIETLNNYEPEKKGCQC